MAVCHCGFVFRGVRGARRGRADGEAARPGGSVGLLLLFWVDYVGAWGRDAPLRRANHLETINGSPLVA